jgi:Arginine/lysine/ornithine decarboxylases
MDTPIVDFVKKYIKSDMARFHMPGHKGHVFFGCEPFDITEVKGADVLRGSEGIIKESQKNAAALFGSGASFYSTEGSTLCIKAMLAILKIAHGRHLGAGRPFILAARNVHRSMMDACALLDFDIRFLASESSMGICSSVLRAEVLEEVLRFSNVLPLGVYVTSPDYLGQIADIAGLSKVCGRWGIPLIVDNAHGAYLHFLEKGMHPMDLGAAMCCDSAHKTLPALTGAAYLHIHKDYMKQFAPYAEQALSLFSSTSPSYLLLQSLDLCNAYLAGEYRGKLGEVVGMLGRLKDKMHRIGISVRESEPLKIVLDTAECGYFGGEIAEEMREYGIECEYADQQNVVLMAAAENSAKDWERLLLWAEHTRLVHSKKEPLMPPSTKGGAAEQVLSVREAVFAQSELVPARESVNRICAAGVVSCPPAIPIAVSGERITEGMAELFLEFGIEKVCVIRQEGL